MRTGQLSLNYSTPSDIPILMGIIGPHYVIKHAYTQIFMISTHEIQMINLHWLTLPPGMIMFLIHILGRCISARPSKYL